MNAELPTRRQILLTTLAAGLAQGCSSSGTGPLAQMGTLPPAGQKTAVSAGARLVMLVSLAGHGEMAVLGKAMKQAAELALVDVNDPTLRFEVIDDGGTADGARAAADMAVRQGAEIIIGPLLAKSVLAAAPVAQGAKIPMLAFSNDRNVAGNGVYLVSFMAEQETDRVVRFAISQGRRRFAALIPDDAYGRVVEPAFAGAVERGGGSIALTERVPVAANAMLEPVKRMAAAIRDAETAGAPIEALFIPAGQAILPLLTPLLAYAGINTGMVRLIGTGGWSYPNAERDPVLAGGWFAAPDPRGWQDFAARFTRVFGSAPPRLASLAYDAVAIAATLSRLPPADRYTAAALTREQGFLGADGPIRLLPGGLPERSLMVLEMRPVGPQILEPGEPSPQAAAAGLATTR